MQLHPSAAAADVRLIVRERVDSTNAQALRLARAGETSAVWIVAAMQTEGRGRRGRSWHSPRGNLHASLLLHDPCAFERAPELSFVAALALYDALLSCAPSLGPVLGLKWPNDLVAGGGKIAGILVEGERAPAGPLAAVLGFGVNCVEHPSGTAHPASDLRTLGHDVAAEALFAALSQAAPRRLAQWDRGRNFAGVRADWLARAAHLGESIRVRTPHDLEGVFVGIDAHGRLQLRGADGDVTVHVASELAAVPTGSGEAVQDAQP